MKDMRAYWCPQCKKQRLVRPLNHVVSLEEREYKTKNGTAIKLLVDICDHCRANNHKKFFEPSRADVKRLIKAIQEESPLKDESLEELL